MRSLYVSGGIVPLYQGTMDGAGINVVPKREWDERKKLGTKAQQKTHAC